MLHDGYAFRKGAKGRLFKERIKYQRIVLDGDPYYINSKKEICNEVIVGPSGPLYYCVACDRYHESAAEAELDRLLLWFSYPAIKRNRMETIMKKPEKGVNGTTLTCSDKKMIKEYPLLIEYLTCTLYDDQTPRKESSLTIFFEGGCMKASLNDRDAGRSLYVTAGTLDGLLTSIEEHLSRDIPGWREWPAKAGKKIAR